MLSIILTASLCCACTQESLTPREPVTRAATFAVDSTADDGSAHYAPITIDTAWVGEEHINF